MSVNNLDENIGGMIFMQDDHIKTGGGRVNNEEGYLSLQKYIDQQRKWTKEWQKEFNMEKCKAIHFGKFNQDQAFTVNAKPWECC